MKVINRKTVISASIVTFIVLFALPILAVGKRGEVPEIVAAKLYHVPNIDGSLDDEAWVEIARSFKGVITGWKTLDGKRLIENQRVVYIGYDDDALYLGMISYVGDVESLIRGTGVWQDDAFEIHLENTKGEYFQYGISCSGDWANGTPEKEFSFVSSARIGKDHWSAEVKIPWKEINVQPSPGLELGFNIAGHDYLNGWITWGPSYGNFRVPSTFGYLKLE